MHNQHARASRPVRSRARAGLISAVLVGLAPLAAASALAQGEAAPGAARRSVTVGHYGANGLHRFLMGSGYRDLWMRPVSVEVLDLSREAGGLRPVARVGGQQTKILALEGRDGRSYTFRGVVKDASHVLDTADPMLKDSAVARKIIDDLMSAQHPASDLIASGILEAAGVPCPAWRLVALPDDPALGGFREEFKGAVGVFAEYPQPAKGAVPGFLGATEIIDHLAMYERLESAGVEAIDARALLRARLTDIFMGDWDRHRKQWRWAKLPGSPLWTPIPEDRDQAFSRYDGYVMDRTRGRDPRFQEFGPRYARIGGLTFNGWDQDHRLLAGFTRTDFVEAAKQLQARLTDEAIEAAARRMPPEWYAIDGSRLVKDLRARREGLPQVAEEFYLDLAKRVDVYLTNRGERVDAVRTPQGDMEVTVRVLGPGNQPGDVTYHRVFLGRETEEVRFYALGGDDVMAVSGGKRGPLVRMVGGKGDDTLDATGAGNAKLSDSEGRNQALSADDDDKAYHAPPPPKNAPWIPQRDFTHETWGQPRVAYNADTGLFLGYGVQHYRYGFRKSPYASGHRLSGGWAFDQESGRVDYLGNFHRENRRTYFSLYGYASGIDVLRFYGFGNETEASQDTDYYKVHATQYVAYPAIRVPFATRWQLSVGPVLKYTSNEQDRNELINTVNPYGAGDYGALAVHGILSWDSRDSIVLPQRGGFAAVRGTWFPEAWDVDSSFGQVNGNVNAYLPLGGRTTLALRGGGKKVFGTYPTWRPPRSARALSKSRRTRCAATARGASRETPRRTATPTFGCASRA